MPQISRASKRWLALLIWILGIIIFMLLSWWNLRDSQREAENRLIHEAGRIAAQLAGLFSALNWEVDAVSAKAVASGAMEDDRIYAVRIEAGKKMLDGQRRNYLWEPVPWDDELADNCVQGINPFKISGERAGKVEVWLSPRLNQEENAMLYRREVWRSLILSLLWTAAFIFIFWNLGGLKRLKKSIAAKSQSGSVPEKVIAELSARNETETPANTLINPALGRRYQRHNPDSWQVTAGMFRHTFARAPALIGRLYSDGEIGGLCHLGRMLEQAAPCLGAEKLTRAAAAMQKALNDPEYKSSTREVENCARILEETLAALGNNRQERPNIKGS